MFLDLENVATAYSLLAHYNLALGFLFINIK